MPAGQMRERISIQSPVRVQDAMGEETLSWVTVHVVWAQVIPLHGSEQFLGNAADPDISHRVLMRHETPLEDIGPEWLVVWHKNGTDRTLGITSVINVAARDRIIELLCKEAR